MNIERFFNGLDISASGLSAQRKKMNAIASNIANAETTRTEEGGPYVRKIVLMREQSPDTFDSVLNAESLSAQSPDITSVTTEEKTDPSPFKLVYDPSHPDANEQGYVELPNVNVVNEMVDMISATRSYEANVTAINAAKSMAKDSLEI